MRTLNTGDCTLNIRVDGPTDGRVVMFGNSLGTDMRVWDLMLPHLPDGLRIVRYDKRGHGLSDCPPAPYHMDNLVSDTAAIADALELTDITFVALSIGGLIAQGLAATRPDLLRAIVLMDTAAKIGTKELWDDRIAMLADVGLEGMAEAVMDRWFEVGMRNDPVALAPWRNMLTRTPAAGYGGCCSAISGSDFTESTRKIAIPVLAMAGEADGATPPDLVKATADLCGAEFHVVKKAGHLPCVEKPVETARLITEFLRKTANV